MRQKLSILISVILLAPLCAAFALPITTFNQLVVFGDSLSDPGNASIATLGVEPGSNYATRSVPGVPFAAGYFTDGTNTSPATTGPTGLWIDQFAAMANLPDPEPALSPLGGTNYAVASAKTGSSNLQDISNQIALFSSTNSSAPSNALYVVWGGANDILSPSGTPNPKASADNLYSNILSLAAGGAKYFMWLNLPDLGEVPDALTENKTNPATTPTLNALSEAFNAEWAIDVAKLESQGIFVVPVNVDATFQAILADPSSFGFTDTTDPAQGTTGNPNNYVFWDGEHPTTAADALIADAAYADLTAVPEPMSVTLALTGLLGLFAAGRMRHKKIG